MQVVCDGCNQPFYKLPNQVKRSKTHFCSKECKFKWTEINFTTLCACDCCGTEFRKKNSYVKETNFCTHECYGKWRSENIRGEKCHNYKDKINYNCHYCESQFPISESKYNDLKKGKFKNIYCSKECKERWESENWKGKNNPNYNDAASLFSCEYCNSDYYVYGKRKEYTRFCSLDCKNNYQKYILPQDPQWVENRRQIAIKVLINQKNKFTKPENMVKDFLEKNNVLFIPQHPMFKRFVVDFYLPEHNIVIEVLGNYWHGHPDIYGDENGKKPLTEKQVKNKTKDIIKNKFLSEQGFVVQMIWESDIYKSTDNALSFLK